MAADYRQFLIQLLQPLGVYDLSEGSASESELFALGAGLHACSDRLEYAERESLVATAEDWGLDCWEALFARKPAAPTTALRRQAIAALVQISGDSFTPSAINATISGSGIRAEAQETDTPGCLRVIFPDVGGEPEDFAQIQKIILDIIPCHLETEFYFRYLTWAECEERSLTWAAVEANGHTWKSFELWV